MNVEIVLFHSPARGWIPKILVDGAEKYRGESHPTPDEALQRAAVKLPIFWPM